MESDAGTLKSADLRKSEIRMEEVLAAHIVVEVGEVYSCIRAFPFYSFSAGKSRISASTRVSYKFHKHDTSFLCI